MRVYRVAQEVADKDFPIGPYQYWNTAGRFNRPEWYVRMGSAHDDYAHRIPQDEGRGMRTTDVCGFISEFSLMEWFDGYLNDLGNAGFRVYEYDAESQHVTVLSTQVVVSRDDLTLIRSYPLNP